MKQKLSLVGLSALIMAQAGSAFAQETDETIAVNPTPSDSRIVDTITVKGQIFRGVESSYSATNISTEDIRIKRVYEINELLEDVPGVSIRDFGLGGVASSTVIRGFGGGAHGGDLGVVIDGIPLNEANSHADGYVDLNVVVPLEVKGLTVFRGPVSALYGNFNRGGLIALETRNSGNYTELDVTAGSFDSFDAQAAFGKEVGDNQAYNFAAQYYRTDGFRPQSVADRGTVSGRGSFQISPEIDLSLSGRYHEAEAESAAYTTLEQFQTDPYGIDPRVQNDGADKTFGTLRADLGFILNDTNKVLAYAYGTQQDFTRWFSRGGAEAPSWRQREETYDRDVYGLGTSLNGQMNLAGRNISYVAGIEHFDETTEFQFYDDLDNRRRVFPAQFNRESTLTSNALFAEADIALTDRLDLSLGVRADEFDGDCDTLGPETGTAPCEELDTVSNVSPKVGLRAQVLDQLQLRASYSEGFALASGFAKFASGAQSLEVNELRQYELGATFKPISSVNLDLAVYDITSSNEINEVTPGEFVNFGETSRTGFETSLSWDMSSQFQLQAVYGYADSEVEENLNPALIGNRVNGVPDHTATLIATYFPVPDIRLTATGRYIGEYFIDSGNTTKAPDYAVLDLDAAYSLNTKTPTQLFVSIDNVTDNVYATTINSLGASPGAPRAVFAGVQVGF
jgi:outer membrane receptor protein involved in Fe transport